jgi:hypothetical protein
LCGPGHGKKRRKTRKAPIVLRLTLGALAGRAAGGDKVSESWTMKENSPTQTVKDKSLCVCEFLSCPDQLLAHAQRTFLVEMWGQWLVTSFFSFSSYAPIQIIKDRRIANRKRNKKEVPVE